MKTSAIVYVDNIPSQVHINKDDSSQITIGYYDGDSWLSGWDLAPDDRGGLYEDTAEKIFGSSSFLKHYIRDYKIRPGHPYGDAQFKERAEYTISKDRNGRSYLLVPANGGYVPVRHGTDPLMGNWLSKESRTKIIYDQNKTRHPAVKGLDYTAHGFVSKDGKSWFPIKYGNMVPNKNRITEPCFQDYEQIFPEKPTFYESLSKVATLGAAVFGALQPNPVANALTLGAATIQLTKPLADGEARDYDNSLRHRQARYNMQADTLAMLEREDEIECKRD